MKTFITEVRQMLVPGTDVKHGPLPPLLVVMTFVTGLVDAFSYLVLGHVFVANMTGNFVFLGFALAGANGFSIGSSLAALASFWVGALVGGRVGKRYRQHRGRLLSAATAIQMLLLAASVILAELSEGHVTAGYRYSLIAVLGIAMGVQNAAARQIAVPDLTTTVLTLTTTGLAADSKLSGGSGSKSGRRLIAISAMLAGAVVGAEFVVHAHVPDGLGIALLMVVVVVGVAARHFGRGHPAWAGS